MSGKVSTFFKNIYSDERGILSRVASRLATVGGPSSEFDREFGQNMEDMDEIPYKSFGGRTHREGIYAVLWRLGYVLRKRRVIIACAIMGITSAYYYNQLGTLQANAETEGSSIVVYLQMRRDLTVNLEKLTTAYINHEKEIFKYVAEIKSAMVGRTPEKPPELTPEMKKALAAKGGPSSQVGALLGQFFGLAEQYPDLKFSTEFHHVVSALMDVEKELAAARVRYNNSVNIYMTALTTIPGNFYGPVFRYKPLPLFVPDMASGNKGGIDFKPMFGMQ